MSTWLTYSHIGRSDLDTVDHSILLRQCQRASKVISPFIIFAVFDVSYRGYKL